jgi:integral membrane protein (TIGR00529 family)
MADLAKLVLIFGLVLFLVSRKLPLWIGMLLASVLLGISSYLAPLKLLLVMGQGTIENTTWTLVVVLYLIAVLEDVLRTSGMLMRLVGSLRHLLRDPRVVASFLPAFMGFLPSAGGALFSAPMVEEATEGMGLSGERKAFVNYWYRHLWECVFPLYPGLILAAALFGIPVGRLCLSQWPFPFVAILAGLPFAYRGVKAVRKAAEPDQLSSAVRDAGLTILPIAAIIVAVLGFKLNLMLVLGAVVLLLLLALRWPIKNLFPLFKRSFKPATLAIVVGVMVFKAVLEASGIVKELPGVFQTYGIPTLLITFLVPFLAGLVTGITQAYVGLTFPILIGLAQGQTVPSGWTAFAFVSGFAGVLLSPVHLCLILTNSYFKANTARVYRLLILPSLALIASGLVMALLKG